MASNIATIRKELSSITSCPAIIVKRDGSGQTLNFRQIGINVSYIQKSPSTGAYNVYKKTGTKNYKFLKDFNGYVEAKEYVIKLYEPPVTDKTR